MVVFRTSSKESRVREYRATQDLPDLSVAEMQAIEESVTESDHQRAFVSKPVPLIRSILSLFILLAV